MIDFTQLDSLIQIMDYFTDEDVCIQAIVKKRWGEGEEQYVVCPYCGGHHCVARKDKRFRCHQCDRNFSCKVGTIFENSNLSFQKWFITMYLISSHKKGMIERSIFRNKKNEVENITYVHAFVVENTTRATLQLITQQFVVEGSRVITDELNACNGLNTLGYVHAVVNHGAAEYADGDVFTNSIEDFWSHFRRMI